MENLKFRRAVLLSWVVLATSMLLPQPVEAATGEAAGALEAPHEYELASGAKAVLWPRPGSGTVLVAVAVPAGSQDEPAGMGGLSHYLEHLLFDGFDALDERGVTEAFERISAYVNAFTREQTTVYFALVPRDEAEQAAGLMAGMLTRSTIGPEVFEKEREVILEELAKDHASPDGLREERLRAVLWAGTPLEHPVGGTLDSVGATTRDEVLRYWRERYLPAGYRILITGDLELGGLQRALAPFAAASPLAPAPPRTDLAAWAGWGEWGAAPPPEETAAAPGAPAGMAMGAAMAPHGAGGGAPAGGTLAVVVAAPNLLAGSSTAIEVLARWLGEAEGPLGAALRAAGARSFTVARQPRVPRDLVELRIEAEVGVEPERLLARVLGALRAAAAGPDDAAATSVQRAWRGERALNDQRLHYAAVFFGEALAAARGGLVEAIVPPEVGGHELRAVAAALLSDAGPRTRAAWLGGGGPEVRRPLPASTAPEVAAPTTAFEPGPLGSLVTTLDNGVVLGILPEVGSEVFGLHLLVADRALREPADLPGAADLLHRLLLGGSALSGSAELAARIRRAGFDLKPADDPAIPFDDRYHVPDFSYVRLEGPAADLEAGLTLLAEIVRAPDWDEEGWRTAIAGHRAARRADNRGAGRAEQLFLARLLGEGHPLARAASGAEAAPIGEPEPLRAVWGSWPSGYFAASRLVLTVASPLPAPDTLGLVASVFAGGSPGAPVRGPYPAPQPAAAAAGAAELAAAPQVTVLWGRMVEVADADRAALLIAMDALADRMTAVIREREGLAYRLGAGVRALPGGAWVASASVGTRPENSERVVALLQELVRELGTEALPPSELERLNARERRSRMLRGLSAAARAYRVGRALFEGPGSPLAVDESAYAAVTPEQLRAAVQHYLVPEEMILVVTP